jgi:hypothetical protein
MSADEALRRSIIRSSLKSSQRAMAAQSLRPEFGLLDAAALVVGGLLVIEGGKAPRRGWIAAGAGMALFYQGLCGLAGGGRSCLAETTPEQETPDEKIARNPVDEAAWESFPASDPPTFAGQTI